MRRFSLFSPALRNRLGTLGLSNNRLFIVLRQSPDWKNLTPSSFIQQSRDFCRLIGRPSEQINEIVALWNSTFDISFFEARQAMKDISIESFKEVERSRLVDLSQVTNGETGPGIYLFTDDDDWIKPSILESLRRFRLPESRAFVWGSAVFGGRPGSPVKLRALDKTCYTNNYAVDYSYFSERREKLSQVSQHWGADEMINKQDLCEVHEYLTMTNKNPSSTLSLEALKDTASSRTLVNSIREYNERLQDLEIPQEAAWARRCMIEVKGFFERLLEGTKSRPLR